MTNSWEAKALIDQRQRRKAETEILLWLSEPLEELLLLLGVLEEASRNFIFISYLKRNPEMEKQIQKIPVLIKFYRLQKSTMSISWPQTL